jgi:hypothetical protein
MTRRTPNPETIRESLSLLDEVLAGRRQTNLDTERQEAWIKSKLDARREQCARDGHTYQVIGRHTPTNLKCSTCLHMWPIGGTEPDHG